MLNSTFLECQGVWKSKGDKIKVHWQTDTIHSQNQSSLANGHNPFSKNEVHWQMKTIHSQNKSILKIIVIVIGMNKIQSLTELFWENAFECIGKVKWMKIYSRTKHLVDRNREKTKVGM